MSDLEILLRLSLVHAELLKIAGTTDDEAIRELVIYIARLLSRKV